jgi:type IV pilus assembly protein PilF
MNKNWFRYSSLLICLTIFILPSMGCRQMGPTQQTEKNTPPKEKKADELVKKINPERAAQLNVELGLAYLDSNQPARGKIKLQHALELAPSLPDVHVAFGRYYESIGELEEAEKSYLKAIKIDKNWSVSHNLYGTFLCRQGKYEKANRSFQKALEDKTYPESASVLENAGLCELAAGHPDQARVYFEKAVRQDINRANSLLELAYMQYEQKKIDIAWQLYSQYLIAANQTPRSLYLGIKLAREFKYYDKEASYLLLLKSEYSDSVEYQQLKQAS